MIVEYTWHNYWLEFSAQSLGSLSTFGLPFFIATTLTLLKNVILLHLKGNSTWLKHTYTGANLAMSRSFSQHFFFGAFNFVNSTPPQKKHIVSNFLGGVALFIWFATCWKTVCLHCRTANQKTIQLTINNADSLLHWTEHVPCLPCTPIRVPLSKFGRNVRYAIFLSQMTSLMFRIVSPGTSYQELSVSGPR